MLFRLTSRGFPVAAFLRYNARTFQTSRTLQGDTETSKNHYETLNLHPGASASEIKRSFYTLSKTHHPDHNPTDPHAPRRFMRISEAYAVLSHTSKRAAYDRDVLGRHSHSHSDGPRKGSYHSTGPAGGRPASGLSRRRGTFQGPPPSFYRSGGWGAHGSKRRAAHEASTGGAESGAGGMGPGQDPFGHQDDVAHFDKVAHERTQRRADERRARRRRGDGSFEPDTGMVRSFFMICGVLAFSALAPWVVLGGWRRAGGGGGKKPKE